MLLVFDDIRKYIGMNVVYFDGRNVYGVYIAEVYESAQKSSAGVALTRHFMVACDKSSSVGFAVKEEQLYMNWNAWMRSILREKHLELPLDDIKYKTDMINKIRLRLWPLCRDMYEKIKRTDPIGVDAFDWILSSLKSSMHGMEQEIKKWENDVRPTLIEDNGENWMNVLIRLMLKSRRKQASREARKQWRVSHVVQ